MWRVDPGPLTPFCIITLRLPNWGVSTSALSVAAAEPTDRLERRNQKQPTHSHPAPKGKKKSLKSPHVEIKFSEDWKQMCSDGQFFHCPCSQWLVLILPSVGENTKFSAWWSGCGGLQLARGVCGACRSRWMRMAGWPDPTLGTTSQWRERTWICVVPEKCWSRVEMFCSYWSFVKLAWPVVFSLKKRKLKTGLQRWLRGDALVLEVWRPELRSPAPSKSQARRHALVIPLLEERQRKLDGI